MPKQPIGALGYLELEIGGEVALSIQRQEPMKNFNLESTPSNKNINEYQYLSKIRQRSSAINKHFMCFT